MKSKVELSFYCYIDEKGMQKHILPPRDTEGDDQEELDLPGEDSDVKTDSEEATEEVEVDQEGALATSKVVDGEIVVDFVDLEDEKNDDIASEPDGVDDEQWEEDTKEGIAVTADGTPVEEAVKNAIDEVLGHLNQPLVMSGSHDGIWSNKKLDGDAEMCKDEMHDLLNAEADGLRAVFVLTVVDKKR